MANSLSEMVQYAQAIQANSPLRQISQGVAGITEAIKQKEKEQQLKVQQDIDMAIKLEDMKYKEAIRRFAFGGDTPDRREGSILQTIVDEAAPKDMSDAVGAAYVKANPKSSSMTQGVLSSQKPVFKFDRSKYKTSIDKEGNPSFTERTDDSIKPNKPIYYIDDKGRATDHKGREVTEVPANAEIIRRSATATPNFDLLKATPGEIALAKAIIEGRAAPSQITSMRGSRREYIAQLVLSIDPTADFTTYPTRNQMRKDYSPGGKIGQQVEQFKFITNHLLDAEEAVGRLKNGDIQIVNKFVNRFKDNIGDPDVNLVNALSPVVGGETAKAIIGSVTAQGDRKELASILEDFKSPQQARAVLDGMFHLIGGRMKPLLNDWKNTFGEMKSPTMFPAEDSETAERLARSGRDPFSMQRIPGQGGGNTGVAKTGRRFVITPAQ